MMKKFQKGNGNPEVFIVMGMMLIGAMRGAGRLAGWW